MCGEKSFELTDLMNLLNGTETYDKPNADGDTVLAVLEKARNNTADKRLKFKLNKEANPTYTVMGYSFDDTAANGSTWKLNPASRGGTITFKADAGLDGILFSPESIKVYLFGPFEAAQLSDSMKTIYENPDGYAESNKQRAVTLFDGVYTGDSRSTWSQSLTIPDDSKIMKAGSFYIIAASGKDKDGIEFISSSPNGSYIGFVAQARGIPPVVTFASPASEIISRDESEILAVTGTVTSEETPINNVQYEISVYDSLNKNALVGTITNLDKDGNDDGSMTITGVLGTDTVVDFKIDARKGSWYPASGVTKDGRKPDDGDAFKYVILVTGTTDSLGKETVTVELDKQKPEATLEISHLLESDNKTNCVNGKITIKSALSDNKTIEKSRIEITGGAPGNPITEEFAEGDRNPVWVYDTTELTDKTEYTVTVFAEDTAGNTGSTSEKIFVDQSTNIPKITLTNADVTIVEESKITLGTNLFGMGSDVIFGTATDDDGIAKISYIIDAGTANAITGEIDMGGKTPTSKSFQIDLTNIVSGNHTLAIEVTDTSSGLAVCPSPVTNSDIQNMAFGYDDDAPSLSVTTQSGEFVGANIGFTITGTATDKSGLKELYRYSTDSTRNPTADYGTKDKPVVITVGTDGSWTDTITTTDNGDEFEYRAVDKYGRDATAKFTYKIDSVKPTITLTQPADNQVCIGETPVYSFRGTAEDPTKVGDKTVDASGIASVLYTVYNKAGAVIKSVESPASTSWNIAVDFSDYKKDGVLDVGKVTFVSVDAGGLQSLPAECSVEIDSVAPTITAAVTVDGNAVSPAGNTNTYYTKKAPTVEISVTDDTKIETVSVSNGSLDIKIPGDRARTYTLSGIADGYGDYVITAKDKSGRISSYTVSVYVDKDNPTPEISSVSPTVSNENGTTEYVNGKITIKGTASDDDSVQKTKLILKQGGVDKTDTADCVTEISNTAVRFEYTVDTTKLSDNMPLEIIIESTDRAGNVGRVTRTVTVDQSTDRPVLKFSNGDTSIVEETGITVGKNLFGMGSDNLYISVTDDDGIKSVSVSVDGTEKNLLSNGTSTTWTYSLPINEYGADVHSLKFTIIDTEGIGNSYSYPETDGQMIRVAYDNDAPVITVTKFNDSVYFENMFAPETFTLHGTATDSSGVVSISCTEGGGEITFDEAGWKQTVTNSSGEQTREYIARDKYGRESKVTVEYRVDTEPPKFISNYITLTGETINGSKSYKLPTDSENVDDPNVYKYDKVWFTNSSFSIRGGDGDASHLSVTETNSFDIKLYVEAVDKDNLISTIQPTGNNFFGTVDVSSKLTGKTYSTNIILIATDEAGNESKPLPVFVKVDKDAPELKETKIYTENPSGNTEAAPVTSGGFVNTNAVYITFSAADTVSQVKSVEVYKTAAMSEKIGESASFSASDNVSGVINVDMSGYEQQTYDFYLKITDNAGNAHSESLPAFTFDTTPPVITYSKPAADSEVNKTISLEGTISDRNPPDTWSLQLEVKKPDKTEFERLEASFTETPSSWKVSEIDTTSLGEGPAEFRVIATDKAGNTISNDGAALKLKIDQNSDRPEIRLTTISTNGSTTLSSGMIAGTISDDDGLQADGKKIALEVKVVEKDGTISDGTWKTATITGSDWKYTYSDGTNAIDGDYKLYFRVTDLKDSVFTSSENEPDDTADKTRYPRISSVGEKEVCSAVNFSIDTNPPTIESYEFQVSQDNNTWSDAKEAWTQVSNNEIFGGTKFRYAKFRVKAYDTVTEQKDLEISVNLSGAGKKLSTADGTITFMDSGEKDENNHYFFETNVVDFNNPSDLIASGSYTIEFEAKDKAERPRTLSLGIIVDNTPPDSITRINRAPTEELTGDIEYSGQVADNASGNSGIAALYYAVPYSTVSNPEALAEYDADSEDPDRFGKMWFPVAELTSVTWNLVIKTDAIYTKSGQTITVKPEYDKYEIKNADNPTGIYNLPVWFKLVDNAGNVGYVTDNTVRYNPDADKPRVRITYPVHNVTDKDFSYVSMGGTVRFSGSAEDDEGIEAVYLQFDMDGDGTYENGIVNDAVIEGCPYDAAMVVPIPTSSEFGVQADGTQSWSYSLKVSGLKGLLYAADNKKTLNVRAVAYDTGTNDTKLLGAWSEPVHISVNTDIPAFEMVELSQYDDTDSSVIKTIDYYDDVYISGDNWYLVGTASSTAGISEVSVIKGSETIGEITINTSNGIDITDTNHLLVGHTEADGKVSDVTYRIPIVSDSIWEIQVEVTDNQGSNQKSNRATYRLNVDNTPPAFYDRRPASEENNYGTIKLYKGEYSLNGVAIDKQNGIQNSNGCFTLAGRTTEAGSGYENVIFYFKRVPKSPTTANPVRVYNPMEAHGTTNKDNRTDITEAAAADGKVYINSDDLPVLYVKTVSRDTEYSLTSDCVGNNKNIRVGGLVKLGGVYRKIKTVDGASVTFDAACETSFTEAEFVYGMVIDNSGESQNYDGSVKNDDGDGMVESYSKSGTNYTWDASIDSTNIPDGPIEIHVVAFDKAGNRNHGYVKTVVSNNAPRIARVRLATDLSGNGSYEENESKVFTYLKEDTTDWAKETESSGTEIWNLDSNGWTIKNNLQIEPEFVGGTAPFYYIFTKEAGADDGKNLSSPETGTQTGEISGNKQPFVLENSKFDTGTDFEDKINTYQFSFWDSTEETTPCTDSQWTILNVQLKQDIADTVAPKAVVSPFYWNSSTDNSLYENSRNNGHIELESDLENGNFTDSPGEYDKDPKVSGKIVIRGTAYDDVRLRSLWISLKGFTFNKPLTADSSFRTGYVPAAIYNTSQNQWQTAASMMDSEHWQFTVEDEYFDQNGHKVNWTLSIDTVAISTITAVDVPFKVMAVDHVNTAAHVSSEERFVELNDDGSLNMTDSVCNVPSYQMDIVPYITGVKTSLSSISKRNPTVYSRSAHGAYPVRVGETVILDGFNLGNTVTVAITADSTSGDYTHTVGGVSSLNNRNNDEAKGSVDTGLTQDNYKTYAYNRQPNDANNNLLTDDVSFAVWQFDPKAAVPISGKIEQPVMKINPVTGNIGFAFVNGPLYFSMGGKVDGNSQTKDTTNHSYNYWMGSFDFFTSVGFVYDKLGYSYGCAAGGDINSGSADKFVLLSSKWGIAGRDQNGSYTAKTGLRLEQIGQNGDAAGTTTTNFFDKQRIKSPSMATTVTAEGSTNLYMAYYDALNDELRFKAGAAVPVSKAEFGDFTDKYTNGTPAAYSNDTVSMIAGSKTGRPAGEYVSIAAIPAAKTGLGYDIVAVVWYADRTLWYSYTTSTPLGRAGKTDGSGWSTPVAVFSGDMSNSGEYCKIVADEDGGIHIAAYDPVNLDLVYAYSPSYNGSFATCVVDSNGVTGSNLTLDVAKVGSSWRPYIGYYETSCVKPKYAYKVSAEVAPDGAEDDLYTLA